MRIRLSTLAMIAMISGLVGCSSSASTPPPGVTLPQNVYYSFASSTGHQIEVAPYPLTNSSTPMVTIDASVANGLADASDMAFDSAGRLFVINGNPTPSTISVFTPPLNALSTPAFTLTLPIGVKSFKFSFDASGNIWIGTAGQGTVYKFNGPFTTNATLVSALHLTDGLNRPEGLAFDSAGNLYVTNEGQSTGVNAVAVFNAPITDLETHSAFLQGPHAPVADIFDSAGNLYVSSSNIGIARYNSNNLANGATPSSSDTTGLLAGYFPSQMVFDPLGNLYVADCGTTAKIYVYPTVATSFSSTLAPTTVYASPNVTSINCAWGIALH